MVLTVAVGWLAVGFVLALIMGRRGHDVFSWLVLGALLGPFGAIFAVEARGEGRARPQILTEPAPGPGSVDVLAGFDGSSEGRAALVAATRLLGPRLGRVTLAAVIPDDSRVDDERRARAALEHEIATMGSAAGSEILRGRPSEALLRAAIDQGYELLVIGARGAGATAALLGSTATDVARSAPIPVLMMGDGGSSAGDAGL